MSTNDGTVVRAIPAARSAGELGGSLFAGRYHLSGLIGEGGMGLVYEGEHAALARRVAVKVLADEFTAKPDQVERFLREARTASQIRHPNVVEVLDSGISEDGKVFFVMEHLDGADLATVLEKRRRLAWPHALAVALQICAALGAAHALGVVHRDVKPENCFLTRQPSGGACVKVLDFGIAKNLGGGLGERKLTQTGQFFGTPHYMAPEQARSQDVDPRADLYAVGAILYELLVGEPPFDGETVIDVLMKHANDDVIPPSRRLPAGTFPPGLDGVVLKALAKDPAMRWRTADEFANALRGASSWPTNLNVTLELSRDDSLRIPLNLEKTLSQPQPALLGTARTNRRRLWFGAGGLAAVGAVSAIVLALASRGSEPKDATAGEPTAENVEATAELSESQNAATPPEPAPVERVAPEEPSTPTPAPAPSVVTDEPEQPPPSLGSEEEEPEPTVLDPDPGGPGPSPRDESPNPAAGSEAVEIDEDVAAPKQPPELRAKPSANTLRKAMDSAGVGACSMMGPTGWKRGDTVKVKVWVEARTGSVDKVGLTKGDAVAKCVGKKVKGVKFPRGRIAYEFWHTFKK